MKNIEILIADDHEVIHNGIQDILKTHPQYRVVGNAFNGIAAVDMALKLSPDIVFMDISMPEMNGIDACRILAEKAPAIKVIALTQYEDNEYVTQFIKAGGRGYLLKNSRKDEFINAIETVLIDKRYISYELSNNLLGQLLETEETKKQEVHLTRREIEIIKKISEEKSNTEIADELSISLRTVETHRRNIMQKLEAKSVVSVLKYAAKHNLIDL